MGPGGVVRAGVVLALACSRGSQSWSNYGEGGGEVDESRCKLRACVPNWESDELHFSPVLLEGRDEGGVFFGLSGDFSSQLMSRQNPISTIMTVQSFLLKEVRSREGESGPPVA